MKTAICKSTLFFAMVLACCVACNNADKKRIAELESQLADEKSKNPVTPTTIPNQTPVAPAQETKPEGPLPVIQFETTEHDFGTIKEGDVVEYTYKVKNTGEAPLIIQGAQPSCGCTVPDYTKEPIPVGGTGYVKAKFDSSNKQNQQMKTITVTANTWPKQTVLRFKAMITPKAGANGPVAH